MSRPRGAAALALLLDRLGEPPPPLHPTVWMGRWIGAARASRRSRTPLASFLEGGAAVAAGAALAALAGSGAERSLRAGANGRALRTGIPGLLGRAALLKPALSLRALTSAGAEVERALRAGELEEARRLLAWHLVSRDTAALTDAEVAAATIESLAENLNDAVVAPLLAFRVGGLPAAYLHRFVNTADAMLGYRTEELEHYGKLAARADDVLGWIPARISALLVALAAPAAGGDPRAALAVARSEAPRTDSPNAGWPMAAMAGALGVRLAKRGAYELNAGGREPRVDDITRARRIVTGAATLAALGVEGW